LIPADPVNWRGIIAAYLQHANSSVPTWMKPSRRGMAAGVPLPSRGSNPNKLHAIFAVDTSGSVGDEQLYIACNYIRKVADTAKNLDVRICLWASQAYYMSPNITDKGALENTLKNIKKFVKSGGNAISDVDRLIKQNKLNPVVTVYITDGQEEESSANKLAQAGNYKKLFIIVNSFLDEAMIQNINNLFARFGRIVFTPNLD
jgi:predicted metal-dependent peptidase